MDRRLVGQGSADPGERGGRETAADPPALRPRNRGRRTGRKLERAPPRAWATPLQVLLLAERAALLTGPDEDFTLIVTIAYTALRWGEAVGLERDYLHPGEIHLEWQLREVGSAFPPAAAQGRLLPQPALGSPACLSTCPHSWTNCLPPRSAASAFFRFVRFAGSLVP